MIALDQLGGLPVPVDIQPSDRVVVILAGFDGHYEKDAFGSVTATSKV